MRHRKTQVVNAVDISMREWDRIRLAKHTPPQVLATARAFAAEFIDRVIMKESNYKETT
jgi:hypothetical protein